MLNHLVKNCEHYQFKEVMQAALPTILTTIGEYGLCYHTHYAYLWYMGTHTIYIFVH